MSTPRYITVDFAGNIYEVTNLFDQFANETDDPSLATSCVIHLPSGLWRASRVDDTEVPIYTVH